MKDFCHVVVLARLTRDPEYRAFQNGGGVCNFGIAYNAESRKDQQSGEWKDVPAFVDCKAFDRGSYKMGSLLAEGFKTGQRILLHARITQETWDDKTTNQKRSKLVLNVEEFHYVEPKGSGGSRSGGSGGDDSEQYDASQSGGGGGGAGEEIPF